MGQQTESQGAAPKGRKPAPITREARWTDAKGRVWRVLANLHFGRYLCVVADRPSHSAEWSAKQIRAALSNIEGGK